MCVPVEKQRGKKRTTIWLFLVFINGSGAKSPAFLDVAKLQRGRMWEEKSSPIWGCPGAR